jgi:predicted flap endonuclease-1-like 5' DNA nuclease
MGVYHIAPTEKPMSKKLVPPTHDEIAALAYSYYEAEGYPHGRDDIHWQRAYEALLTAPTAKQAAKAKPAATDISLIDGVGPALTEKLKAAGYATLADIAGLTVAALEKLDAKLGLKGRSMREDWIAQAKELVAGAAPRAKIDQKKAAKAKA